MNVPYLFDKASVQFGAKKEKSTFLSFEYEAGYDSETTGFGKKPRPIFE